jgi:FMN phosphatase YigB (HAD superfamily)
MITTVAFDADDTLVDIQMAVIQVAVIQVAVPPG